MPKVGPRGIGIKLHMTQVEEILDVATIMGEELNQKALATEYEVTPQMIHRIVRRKAWTFLDTRPSTSGKRAGKRRASAGRS